MIHDTQSAQILQKQDERNIYLIMKTMCPPGYHYNGFVATHALVYELCIYVYPEERPKIIDDLRLIDNTLDRQKMSQNN